MSVTRPRLRFAAAAAILLALSAAAGGASSTPISIAVDASEAPRRIFHARLTIPAAPGPLTLVYPKWLPGEHGPTGPIADLAGLRITAGGQAVAWKRQFVMNAFDVTVPAGASAIEVALDYLSPAATEGFTAGASATAQLVVLSWHTVLLYPKGPGSNDLLFAPSLRLPPGWKSGTSLRVQRETGDTVEFAPVTLVTLIDSPVAAGAHFQTLDLSPGQTPPHVIHVVGDSAAAIGMNHEDLSHYKRLIDEAWELFGARHYTQYCFLLTLSDHVASFGLEHHESSDNRVAERALLDDAPRKVMGTLLSHEYFHSWNGKYRRPAELATGVAADFQAPVRTDLLWVYEGLTNYYGDVLGARSGIHTPELFRENLAILAAEMDRRAGRAWRPLGDTATAAQILYGARPDWLSWRRGVDFYPEGDLVWLEADVLIRQKTGGKRSLDDFCRAFHGGKSGPPEVKTYTREDVVVALNQIAPHDWDGFFHVRIDQVAPRAPLGGIEAGGWRLVYTDQKPALTAAWEAQSRDYDYLHSLGLTIHGDGTTGGRDDGVIRDAVPGMAAARAGAAPGMRLIAVNGRRYSDRVLREALKAARGSKDPIELLVENVESYSVLKVDYHEGEKHPHLERDASKPDLLSAIAAPRTPQPEPLPAVRKSGRDDGGRMIGLLSGNRKWPSR